MNKNIVRIQIEKFTPGEVARGYVIDNYLRPPQRSVWYPRMPHFSMVDDPEGIHTVGHPGQMLRFDEGGLFFRFAALGVECDGMTNGDIEAMLTTIPASKLFAEDLPHLAEMAEMRLDVLVRRRVMWAMLAVYNVDAAANKAEFEASLELEDVPTADLPEEAI